MQANVMMLGEALCMVAYILYWMAGGLQDNKDPEQAKEEVTNVMLNNYIIVLNCHCVAVHLYCYTTEKLYFSTTVLLYNCTAVQIN